MIEHFVERKRVCASFSVSKSEIFVDAETPRVVIRIVGIVNDVFLDLTEMWFNNIEPGGIGRCPDRHNVVSGEVS